MDHALKPRHDIGKQRASAVPALIVHVPDWDELGNPFVRRDAGQEKRIQIRREGRPPRPLCRIPDGRGGRPTVSVCRHPAADRGTAAAPAAAATASVRSSRVRADAVGEVRIDANKIANVRRATHRSHPVSGCIAARTCLAKNRRTRQSHPRQAVIRWTSSGGSGGASPQPCTSPRRVAGTREGF
jgi:hypothetical protein